MSAVMGLVLALAVGGSTMADVDGYLERSAEAEFVGEQLVSCQTPDGDRTSLFDVAQVDGAVVAWSDGEEASLVRVAQGLSVTVAGGEVESTRMEGTLAPESDIYTVGPTVDTRYLGREAVEVVLLREGEERVELTVDSGTDAVLRTKTLDGDGATYCDRRLLSFTTDLSGVPSVDAAVGSVPQEPIESEPEGLPVEAEGFELVDSYELEDGTLSYYSDGFFSAGVVVTSRPFDFPDGEEVVEIETEGGEYRRSHQAGSVTLSWESGSDNIAVIGDLPPDLLDSFVAALPQPSSSGFFGRIWQRLFG